MSDKKYRVIELGNEGQHQEQEVDYDTIKERAIQLIPDALYPILVPLLKAIVAWRMKTDDERWWMISYADRVGPIGNYVTFAPGPYDALFRAVEYGCIPPNGFIEVAAWMGPNPNMFEGGVNNLSLTDKFLTPEEAKEFDFVWNT